ncbi:TPA: Dabb family protein [Escherichia coli]|uniref:Dabb family protein n=1 Tax=Escherichia coli TaxID=562 RepID=UPI000D12B8AF|nr:Dabb family protein [Escherichia coli]EFA8782083.1 Dabb family protein [Escherichia coli O105]EMA3115650.1 Dabb family protein [Salmonella enterica]EEU3019646.1 Dabb family protein [Escherichia coli]EHX0618406.1 Dabb family protein [Escherichia coli]EIE4714094.1 Dabb family protein [Escherichia coli]
MLKHIFIGKTYPGKTEAELSAVVDILRQLPSIVPRIKAFSVEKTLDWSETQAVVLIAEFDSREDWERYMRAPDHLALGEKIKDIIDLSCMSVVQTIA